MIKINGAGDLAGARNIKKPRRKEGSFAPTNAAASTGAASTTSANASAHTTLSALLSLQSGETPGRKTFAAAQQMLDQLEQLQLELIEGQLDETTLGRMSEIAQSRPHAGADPSLNAVHDEIRLRARVELAKRGR